MIFLVSFKSNSYEAITDGKFAVYAGKKAELTLNSTAL